MDTELTPAHVLASLEAYGHGYGLTCPGCGRKGHTFEKNRPESELSKFCTQCRTDRLGHESATN